MSAQTLIRRTLRWTLPASLLLGLVALGACTSSDTTIQESSPQQDIPAYGPVLYLDAPATLTGGTSGGSALVREDFSETRYNHRGPSNCNYLGHGSGDPFLNGRRMTRFLVGAVASWSCVGNNVMRIVDFLVFVGALQTDGTPLPVSNPEPEDPNWVTLTVTGTTNEVRLFWGVSPDPGTEGFYLAWDDSGGTTTGTLIIDVMNFAASVNTAEDPNFLRLDFTHTPTSKTGEMFLSFFVPNPFAASFRIRVDKDLAGDDPKWVAKGILDLKAQFDPNFGTNTGNNTAPVLRMFTVANSTGQGAALALMDDIGLSLPLATDHLGHYLFDKNDRYYFNATGAPQYVLKTVSSATYLNGKSIASDANFPDSDGDIDSALGLSANTYATCTAAEPTTHATCVTFLDALFGDAIWWSDTNFGSEPVDWRSGQIDAAEADPLSYFLQGTCPGYPSPCTWDAGTGGVFQMTYPPN